MIKERMDQFNSFLCFVYKMLSTMNELRNGHIAEIVRLALGYFEDKLHKDL